MELSKSYCRANLTPQDMEFIEETLIREAEISPDDLPAWNQAMKRDALLDNEAIFLEIIETDDILRVSAQLYFYVLLRHATLEHGVDSRDAVDYMASLLAKMSASAPTQQPEKQLPPPLYLMEALEEIEKASESDQFFLRVKLANNSLFMSGLFKEYLQARTDRKGAPALNFYESFGQSQYLEAASHRLAKEYELTDVFELLGEQFVEARRALGTVGERLTFLGEDPSFFDKI